MNGVVRLRSLEQVRAISDPFRVTLLAQFNEPRTPKQVADSLKVPATRLYHHVAVLEKVGLLEFAHSKQKRGTQERYYRAIGTSFAIDPSLFEGGHVDSGLMQFRAAIAPAIEAASSDIIQTLRHNPSVKNGTKELPLLVSQFATTLTSSGVLKLTQQLQRWVREARKAPTRSTADVEYGALILFYPRTQPPET
jgi:DNA-binding transcriptional ArsR family regulator